MSRTFEWLDEYDAKALAEGWLLSADDVIERDDDQPEKFEDDNAALAYVTKRAASGERGTRMHQAALYFHNLRETSCT